MKLIRRSQLLALSLMVLLSACEGGNTASEESGNEADEHIAAVKENYAPDARVALFDVEASEKNEEYVLKGESNLPEAVSDLKNRLEEENISYVDSIRMLPSEDLEGRHDGIIKISVANLRSKPSHSSELVTQATLGTPVKVYKKEENWYYIQTPDGYLAWVDSGGVNPISEEELSTWKRAEKVIYLEPFGFSYEEADTESEVVSDLVAGNILELKGEQGNFYEVNYPNDRTGYIEKGNAQPYEDWVASLEPTGESLIQTSKSLKGLPYLWGGTSSKGVDCSGYTKTIYFLNGIILPRDASQQIHAGIEVDSTGNFENMMAGDLLFFGRKATDTTAEKVVHVGMWIGDNRFIHSMGDVHVSTMDTTAADFDKYNYNRYLRTKRILGQEDERLIQLAQSDLFMEKEIAPHGE